jgi:hypothetical protein
MESLRREGGRRERGFTEVMTGIDTGVQALNTLSILSFPPLAKKSCINPTLDDILQEIMPVKSLPPTNTFAPPFEIVLPKSVMTHHDVNQATQLLQQITMSH